MWTWSPAPGDQDAVRVAAGLRPHCHVHMRLPWGSETTFRVAGDNPACELRPICDTRDQGLLTVRSAVADDEQAVIALWRACDLVVPYNDPSADFRFAKAGPASDVLVAVDDAGTVVGSVMVGHDGHRGWLYYVSAQPGSQGQGIGRRVVEAAEDWLRQRGVVKVQLMVRETNTKVVSFYEHLGFEVAPRVVMSRWLGKAP